MNLMDNIYCVRRIKEKRIKVIYCNENNIEVKQRMNIKKNEPENLKGHAVRHRQFQMCL